MSKKVDVRDTRLLIVSDFDDGVPAQGCSYRNRCFDGPCLCPDNVCPFYVGFHYSEHYTISDCIECSAFDGAELFLNGFAKRQT